MLRDSSAIHLDSVSRSNIAERDLMSEWSEFKNLIGFLCEGCEAVGQSIELAETVSVAKPPSWAV